MHPSFSEHIDDGVADNWAASLNQQGPLSKRAHPYSRCDALLNRGHSAHAARFAKPSRAVWHVVPVAHNELARTSR